MQTSSTDLERIARNLAKPAISRACEEKAQLRAQIERLEERLAKAQNQAIACANAMHDWQHSSGIRGVLLEHFGNTKEMRLASKEIYRKLGLIRARALGDTESIAAYEAGEAQ